jgi:ParB family transcriptional regulator, chromosome partitioning protein
MTAIRRRSLNVDDPLAAGTARDQDRGSSIGDEETGADAGRLRAIPLEQIRANPDQPRKRFETSALTSLAASIRERGVLQPIIVRPVPQGFEVVAGERRWRAAAIAGEATIPALIDDAVDDAGSLQLALIENVVRENLTPIEQARTFATLIDDVRLTAGVLAKRLGRSRADIANTVRLLELPDEAIELIGSGEISKGHGKALLAEPDHERRRALVRRAADAGWSVRALEAEIARGHRPARQQHDPHPDHCAVAAELESALTRAIGREARAIPYRDGFRITLDQGAAERLALILGADSATL